MNCRSPYLSASVASLAFVCSAALHLFADCPTSRITDPQAFAHRDTSGYAHRQKVEFIMERLDIRPGDHVLDLGAGDGWWTEHLARKVGTAGTVHAAEVSPDLVTRLENRFADTPQVKPYLCPQDKPGLPQNSVDLVFLSAVYHHLNKETRVEYWRELANVVRPTGRVAILETYPAIATRGKDHGTQLSKLIEEAEQGGWVAVEVWYLAGTQHYLAIFVQQRAFFEPSDPANQ
ncbi:MAG: class I SAM-dependent methyltransferase [Thermogutta sp.]